MARRGVSKDILDEPEATEMIRAGEIFRGYGVAAVFLCSVAGQAAAELPKFETIEIDPHIGDVCYAVTVADVDGDGDSDAVAISEDEAVWYRNPDWEKFVMISDAVPRDHVCIAPSDIDGDGQVDFALGAGWPQNGGSIHWIHRQGESAEQPWQVQFIGAEPWTHRMHFADVLGRGRPQLVVSPLNATTGPGVRLLAFPIPENPTSDWRPVVMDASLNRVHNHLHLTAEAGDRAQTLTASQEGISRIAPIADGGFERVPLFAGATGDEPADRGAGEIKAGQIASGPELLGTIEPMHGHQVVVYLVDDAATATQGQRVVLDDTLSQGHAIAFADLDGDGADEVIAGSRQPSEAGPPGIFLYRADDQSAKEWTRHPLDVEKMACEDLVCHDFDGDGRVDILAGGRATHNVRLYRNLPPSSGQR